MWKDSEQSLLGNKPYNYLCVTKHYNIEKYNYIRYTSEGLREYLIEISKSTNGIEDMYYILRSHRLMSAFYRKYLREYFNSAESFLGYLNVTTFRQNSGDVSHKLFRKNIEIREIFDKSDYSHYVCKD